MLWLVLVAVVILLSCLAAVAVAAWMAFQRVKSLGRAVAAASERIADAAVALEEIAPGVHSDRIDPAT